MPPLPTAAAAVRSSTPRAKSSVSTPPTWTDSPEAPSEFPSIRSVPSCKRPRSSSKISYFPPPAPVLARLISLPRIRLFIRDARAPLESPPQRELDQPWVAGGLGDFSEWTVRRARQIRLDVGHRWIPKVGVVPQVEEVGREAHFLPLPDLEMLQKRHIPVLLEWTVVKVAPQIPEPGDASVARRVRSSQNCALSGSGVRIVVVRRRCERCWIQVPIRHARVNIPTRQSARNARPRSQTCAQQRSAPLSEGCGACARIENREQIG